MARRLVLKMSMTLDGYVGGPDGENDWIFRTGDPAGRAWVEETLWQAGAHLVGRRTYDDWVGYWPNATGPIAAPMNAIPKIVFSRSGERPPAAPAVDGGPTGWEDTRVLGGELAPQIAALKEEPGKDLLVQGGASFARSLVHLGLIDEYRLLVHPVVLGAGLPLFERSDPFDLSLVGATTFDSGTLALVYHPR